MLRFARLTLLIAFFASFLAASLHVHADSHESSGIHESCSVCLQGSRVNCIDSPNLDSELINRVISTIIASPFVTLDDPLYSIDLHSISLRGPPRYIS